MLLPDMSGCRPCVRGSGLDQGRTKCPGEHRPAPGAGNRRQPCDTKHDGSYGTVSAKLQVLRETPVTPAIAVGVEDIGDRNDRRGYVAVSKA